MRLFVGVLVGVLFMVQPGVAGEPDPFPTGPTGTGALIEMRVLEIPADVPDPEQATYWHDAFDLEPAKDDPRSLLRLDAAAAMDVLARAKKIGSQRTVTRTWVADGHATIAYDMHEESYVQDYDLEFSNRVELADPIIGTIREGVSIGATPLTRGASWGVRFNARFAGVIRPIAPFRTRLGGHEVEIQLPELRLVGVDETVEVAGQSAWFLLGTPVTWADVEGKNRTTRVVLVRVERTAFHALELGSPDEEGR